VVLGERRALLQCGSDLQKELGIGGTQAFEPRLARTVGRQARTWRYTLDCCSPVRCSLTVHSLTESDGEASGGRRDIDAQEAALLAKSVRVAPQRLRGFADRTSVGQQSFQQALALTRHGLDQHHAISAR
jgi:hypothetical protein